MKHPYSQKVVCLFFSALMLSQNALAAPFGKADLVCDHPVFDFGQREEGETITHQFVLRNKGETDLLIDQIDSSCGCTVATISSDSIPAGTTAVITAQLDLKKRVGLQDKKINISVKRSNKPLELTFKGIALERTEVKPRAAYFGQLKPDATPSISIRLRGLIRPLDPSTPTCNSPLIDYTLLPGAETNQYQLTVSLKKTPPPGEFSTQISIPVYGETETIVIPVFAYVPTVDEPAAPIIVSPKKLTIQKNDLGGAYQQIISLRPGGERNFHVLEVTSPPKGLNIKIHPLNRGGHSIILSGTLPENVEGEIITIRTDLPGAKEIKIPFSIEAQ